jgi:hypothetical protein
MIQANELRIGNWVILYRANNYPTNEIHKVDAIDINISPIPLTEEWLVKLGNIVWLFKDDNGYFVLFNNKRINIDFVHSLQNIYFCIEQKELL